MNPETIVAGTASLFLALGDKTRLRLLNLMRDREICVSSFTGVLGQSQPLISRHLAYLRNSGIVEARRDGKWIHYSISSSLDANTGRLLFELFKWMEKQEGLQVDRDRYFEISGEMPLVQTADSLPARKATRRSDTRVATAPIPAVETDRSFEPKIEYEDPQVFPEPERYYAHHNELEDFLL